MKGHILRRTVSIAACLALLCAAGMAYALETVERDGKLYVADWDDPDVYHYTGEHWDDGWVKYYVREDGEVPTGWFRDEKGQWRYANSEGLISTPWSLLLEDGPNALTIPAEVDSIQIEDLSGMRRDVVLYVTPGSYGERFALGNAFPYDNGVVHVAGNDITNESEKISWIISNYITPGMSDIEKARVLHDWITHNTRYDLTYSHYDSRNLLLKGNGVCDAHAKAYEKLLKAAGLEGMYISGQAGSGGHAWNLLKVNGTWYHIDSTWDNPVSADSMDKVSYDNEPEFSGHEKYNYFIKSDNEIGTDHSWTNPFIRQNNVGGFKLIDGRIYYCDETTGQPISGWKTMLDVDFSYDTTNLTMIEDAHYERYHFDQSGTMETGWRDIDGNRYYFNDEGVMSRGQDTVDGETRFFDQSGRLLSGVVWIKNQLISLDGAGKPVTRIQSKDGKDYLYPEKDQNNAGDGRVQYDNATYQLDGNNEIVTGIVRNGDEIHYYGADGKQQSGWVQTNDGWGYISNGKLLTGGYYTLEQDGKEGRFNFDKNGMMDDMREMDWSDTDDFSFPDAAAHIHVQEIIPGTEATLTTPGLTRGIRCAECGEILSPQAEIPPFSKVACFVDRCYDKILDRQADEGGLNGWTEKLEAQYLSASNIISGFVNSQEFETKPQSNEEKVEIMYNTMLGRPSDPGGKAYWVSMLDAGLSINAVASGFSGSQEFIGICNQYGIDNGAYQLEPRDQNAGVTGFVRRCYQIALGRSADNGGLNHWCGELLGRAQTPQEVARGFTTSPEMQSKQQSNEEYVRTMYELYLGREPDPDGFAYWVNQLENGTDRSAIENGFAYSREFEGIVEGYGLQ